MRKVDSMKTIYSMNPLTLKINSFTVTIMTENSLTLIMVLINSLTFLVPINSLTYILVEVKSKSQALIRRRVGVSMLRRSLNTAVPKNHGNYSLKGRKR